jgi:hypothetical protein
MTILFDKILGKIRESDTPASLIADVNILKNIEYEVTYFEQVNSDSGAITPPTGATILLNQYSGGVDALVSSVSVGQPTGENPTTAGGVIVDVASFDAAGNYTLDGIPSAYPVAIIYVFKIKAIDYGNVNLDNVLNVDVTGKQAASLNLTALSAFNTPGILVYTGSNTFTARSVVGGTNITVTNGDGVAGNISVAFSGTLAVANGGTGISTYTIGDIIYADGAASLAKLPGVAVGSVLISGGVGAAPSWSSIIGLGTAPVNGGAISYLKNTSTGTSSYQELQIRNSSNNRFSIRQNSTLFTTSGLLTANQAILSTVGAGGLLIASTTATTEIIFSIGGTAAANEYFRVTTTGHNGIKTSNSATIGLNTDPISAQPITASYSLNGNLITTITNTSSGTAAANSIVLSNSGGVANRFIFQKFSTAYTTAGLLVADLGRIYCDGNILIQGNGSSNYIIAAIGGSAASNEIYRITSAGIGISGAGATKVTSPSAYLHLGAGEAGVGKAPLKFALGTTLTAAETGTVEFNGTNLFFTPGVTRNSILMSAIANVVSPTAPDRTITVNINGTDYYIHAKTTND